MPGLGSPVLNSCAPAAWRRISPKRRSRAISPGVNFGNICSRRVSIVDMVECSDASPTRYTAALIAAPDERQHLCRGIECGLVSPVPSLHTKSFAELIGVNAPCAASCQVGTRRLESWFDGRGERHGHHRSCGRLPATAPGTPSAGWASFERAHMSVPSLRVDDHHRFTPEMRDEG